MTGSSGEAGNTKMAKLETTSAGNTTAQREVKEDNSSGNGGAGGSAAAVMTAAMAIRAVQDGTMGLAEVGRRGF
jgi:hypothetical protein